MVSDNIYIKLQNARCDFLKEEVKKTGNNAFAKFNYFELGDFVPTINELLKKYKLYSHTTYNEDFTKISLTIINTENPEEILKWVRPAIEAETSKQAIQNSGATDTYHRRYLWLMAFEIVENDMVDSTSGKGESKPNNNVNAKKIKELVSAKEVEELAVIQFIKSTYGVDSYGKLDNSQAEELMKNLERYPNKVKKLEQ